MKIKPKNLCETPRDTDDAVDLLRHIFNACILHLRVLTLIFKCETKFEKMKSGKIRDPPRANVPWVPGDVSSWRGDASQLIRDDRSCWKTFRDGRKRSHSWREEFPESKKVSREEPHSGAVFDKHFINPLYVKGESDVH